MSQLIIFSAQHVLMAHTRKNYNSISVNLPEKIPNPSTNNFEDSYDCNHTLLVQEWNFQVQNHLNPRKSQ